MKKDSFGVILACILTLCLLSSCVPTILKPMEVPSDTELNTISMGAVHSAAVTTDGKLYTWGDDNGSKLGYIVFWNSFKPVKVPGLSDVIYISMGDGHSAAITKDGNLYVWGRNSDGELGLGDTNQRTHPTKVTALSDVVAVSLGSRYSAAITTNGDLYTWGSNASGQLGLGDTENRSIPTKVPGLSNVIAVSLSIIGGGGSSIDGISYNSDDCHSAAITADGSLYVWGSNIYGKLGLGDTENRSTPTKVPGLSNVIAVSLGSNHSAAITADGKLYTWGYSSDLGLGHFPGISYIDTPTAIPELSDVVAVSLGGSDSAAITANGDFYTWGSPLSFEGGAIVDVPTKVQGLSNVVAVSLGCNSFMVLTENGELYTRGYNLGGELGLGDQAFRDAPQLVMSGVLLPK